jgi:peptidoglycan/xylan/chitin deacetylase (PgdA/CDA1 family)
MERRRFLAIGATSALLLAGCGRLLREDEAHSPEGSPSDPDAPSGNSTSPSQEENAGHLEPAPPDTGEEEPQGSDPAEEVDTDGDPAEVDDTDDDPADGERPEVDPELLTATPREWGEAVTGVGSRLADTSAIALTLDACGGPNASGYDDTLIEHLRRYEVPATLFMNARWVEANRASFDDLAADPLFEIANHGTEHRPLSVNGRSVYGITGTASAEAVIDEVWDCQRLLTDRTGTAPRFFRSGTAYYDDVAVRIVHELGLEVAGYSVLGDAGATFSAPQVRDALSGAGPGSIVLLHMNHPASGTADGVATALPDLLERGVTFTTLGRHTLR